MTDEAKTAMELSLVRKLIREAAERMDDMSKTADENFDLLLKQASDVVASHHNESTEWQRCWMAIVHLGMARRHLKDALRDPS